MYIVNTPSLFTTLFAMLKPFVDPVTLSKIEVMGGSYADSFAKLMDTSQIPPCLGGTSEAPMAPGGLFQSEFVGFVFIYHSACLLFVHMLMNETS
jgi:hypothetical protein